MRRTWTEPPLLEKSFCSRPWTTTKCEIDPGRGETFRTVLTGPDGTTMDKTPCYLEVVPNRRPVFTTALGPG
jgi:uncharacterized protein YndB with AHSA1/START domain